MNGIDISKLPLGLLVDLPIISRGIASSGTVEWIGSDSDSSIINGGSEGNVRIDVIVQYGGYQDIKGIMKVCQLSRPDGTLGVGVYVSAVHIPYTLFSLSVFLSPF